MNVQIGGRQLHYVEKGKGKPVIFIHSSLTDYRSWQFQMESFSEKYRAVSHSRRFAYPDKKVGNDITDNTIEGNAADLAELINKLDMAPARLIGHSSGAFIALNCACHNPKLVKTLILGEPSPLQLLAKSSLKDDTQLVQSYKDTLKKAADEAFNRRDYEKAVRIILDVAMGMQNVFDHIPEQTRKSIMDNTMGLQSELESEIFTVDDARQIAVPTLFVKGEYSPRLFHRIIEILSDNMPNTEQVTIPGVSHDLGRSAKPDIFNTKLLEFLAKHDS